MGKKNLRFGSLSAILKFFGTGAVHRGTMMLQGGGKREQQKRRHLKSNGNSHPLLYYPLIGFFLRII